MEKETSKELKKIDYTIAGAFSGVVSRFIGQPLDVLKIRFQIQNVEDGVLKYRGLWESTRIIFKEEGVTAFWKGHVPAQALSIVFGATQFVTFEYSKSLLKQMTDSTTAVKVERLDPVINFLSGGNAGIAALFIVQPLDVIRTRTVMNTKINIGILPLTRAMINENGVRTFFKGLTPNLLSVYPQCAFNFLFYGLLKETWKEMKLPDSKVKTLFCGCVSGSLSKVLLLPLDNVKKRLQMNGSLNFDVRYYGMVHCFRTVLKEQGLNGFYRGVFPSLLKAAVVTGTTFFVYEEVCDFLKKYHGQ